MGIMHHHAVIATTCFDNKADELQVWIDSLDPKERALFGCGSGWVNRQRTFVLMPDGSKEGWADSDRGDQLRAKFIARLQDDHHTWEWVEVAFGELGQKLMQGNYENRY